ncbi:hypothetical protein [Pedobacter sp. SYP-B3415]|uniref:hypothetical protein n=1 Tax=Pedobacter sp. SYP-B3415 TaxID=2496641 RepID=UPI00101DE80D|nr:hypothetical protein [Pedobacter sp. SYP-B3415]
MANKDSLVIIMLAIFAAGCLPSRKDTFNTVELTSSKGEKIYINSLNWGVTDDYQMTAISKDKKKARHRSDSINVIKGLDPFFYRFRNDTLNLYFDDQINYRIKEKFKTAHIRYIALSRQAYTVVQHKAYQNLDGYCAIPTR